MDSLYQNASSGAKVINKNLSIHVITAKQNKAEDCLKLCNLFCYNKKKNLIGIIVIEMQYAMCISQFSSVAQSCPALCNPMNRSTPGLPAHQQLPELTQTQVHRVSDVIQPSHPLSSPYSPVPKSLPASESFPMSQLFA